MSGSRDPIEAGLGEVVKAIGGILSGAGWGVRKLKQGNRMLLIGLVFTVALTAAAVAFRSRVLAYPLPDPVLNYVILVLLVMAPVVYLNAIGAKLSEMARHFQEAFRNVGFVGRDRKPPKLLHYSEHEKRVIMRFASNIPLEKWIKSLKDVETALDVTVTRIDQGRSKRVVEVRSISAEYQIPTTCEWSDELIPKRASAIILGESALGPIELDLNRNPHILVAGETGSGKSVLLRTILWQLVKKHARVFMVDFKGGVEFGRQFEQYGPVVTEHKEAVKLFRMLVEENRVRLAAFREADVKNIEQFNDRTGENLCRIGIIIDELAEMTDRTGANKETKAQLEVIEGCVSTLARLARATGINLILGTQRPDAKVVTGQIKTNVPVRISGRFADDAASMIVLGNTKATRLKDIKGRFLFKSGPDTVEFQGYYFDDSMLQPMKEEPGDLLMDLDEGEVTRRISAGTDKVLPSADLTDPGDEEEIYDELEEEYQELQREMLDLNFDFDELERTE